MKNSHKAAETIMQQKVVVVILVMKVIMPLLLPPLVPVLLLSATNRSSDVHIYGIWAMNVLAIDVDVFFLH